MSDELDTTEGTLPDQGGEPAANEAEQTVGLAELLGKELGKTFPDDETALKAVKDTFSYVGKKQETKAAPVDTNNFVPRREFEDLAFYSENPEYKSAKDLIQALDKEGKGAAAVVASDQFKSVYEKVKSYDETQQSKSVLQSNPRLGQVVDKLTQAREASSAGDSSKAAQLATRSVIEAFEL